MFVSSSFFGEKINKYTHTSKPEYRLELKEVNAKELGYVVEKEFGDGL